MADDKQLSSKDIQDLQDIAGKLPNGHPMQMKIGTLLNSQGQGRYSESSQVASRPSQGGATFADPGDSTQSLSAKIGQGEETAAQGNAEMGRQYVQSGPMEVGRGLKEAISGQNVPGGIHRAVKGAAVTSIPVAASTLPIAAMTAPGATVGGIALGTGGQMVGKYGAKALGASDDWSDVAGDVTGAAAGYAGAKGGGLVDKISSSFRYKPPTSIPVPFGLGKFETTNPYEEMGRSAQYRDLGRDAMNEYRSGSLFDKVGSGSTGSGTEAAPLRPLIGSPSDWQAYDQQMGILEPEARTAGMYSAARGGSGRKLNLQQRIAKGLQK